MARPDPPPGPQSPSRTGPAYAAPLPRSAVAEIAWPPVPNARAATLLATLRQFEATEWWPAERLLNAQFQQLARLADHAFRTVPFYRARLEEAGIVPGGRLDPDIWRRLKPLTRADLRDRSGDLESRETPGHHGKVHELQSGGSTGVPVRAKGTALSQLFWQAVTVRDHLWQRRDFSRTLAAIRYFKGKQPPWPDGMRAPGWDTGTAAAFPTGPSVGLSYLTPIDKQLEWLYRQGAAYLVTHPTLLRELVRESVRSGKRPENLRQISTIGEVLPPELRAEARTAWGVSVADIYSSQETGYIALQAPRDAGGDHYLVQSEAALVEVVDAAGAPCGPGETGRVLVTPLHNFAMPLLRYDLGDLAVAGGPCPSGRGLPTLERIMGRTRNMLVRPDGAIVWPIIDHALFKTTMAVAQQQVIQHAIDDIEVKLVVREAPTAEQEAALRGILNEGFGHAFPIRFTYVDEIPRTRSGKFEDFVSRLLTETPPAPPTVSTGGSGG